MTVIHWFRRDLRLEDNTALAAALQSGERVLPVFIFDPAILGSPMTGSPRLAFMLQALEALDRDLRAHGSGLLIQHGDPVGILSRLVKETRAQAVYANRDYSPYARQRDATVAAALPVPLQTFDDAVLQPPGAVVKDDGTPYTVYTPFMKRLRDLPPPPRPHSPVFRAGILAARYDYPASPIPTLTDLGHSATIALPAASAAEAQRRLRAFVEGPIYGYSTTRNALIADPFQTSAEGGTSVLSPYLRFGMLSPRQAYWAAREALDAAPDRSAQDAVATWTNELIWREFYMHILYHFPHVMRGSFRPEYDALAWRDAPDELEAWKQGHTGYPVVDAAMRQLRAIGWLPNRARMIVASFLTKDLLINWREGERHFMQWLIDGDPAANNGGWQWTAGTGTDAQPYFRIFHPVSQSQKFDPDGTYIRHWVPELRGLSGAEIHAPWESDRAPADYPAPMIDHAAARERTLAAFGAVKRAADAR